MDAHKEEELKRILENLERAQPSAKLYEQVMGEVSLLPVPQVSQSLIGKKGWMFIGLCFLLTVIGLMTLNPIDLGGNMTINTPEWSWNLPQLDWTLPFNGSESVLYAVLFMGIFFGLQIKILSKRFLGTLDNGQLT